MAKTIRHKFRLHYASRIVRNTLAILNRRERQRMGMLVFLDIVISLADIISLALLLFIIHFYTQPAATPGFSFLPRLFDHHSLLLIALFFLVFSLKNLAGFFIYRGQCRFLYDVASRVSLNKLRQYLEGDFPDYVDVDSAVQVRKISNEPIEFAQHILGGIQQIMAQLTLILLTVIAILFFNARLFLLLFIVLLPPVIAAFGLMKKRLRAARAHARISSERALQHLQEALAGFVESNIYHKHGFFLERYDKRQRQFNKYLSDLLAVQGMPNRMIEIFALLGLFLLIAINQWTGSLNNNAIITIGAFMAAAYKIIPGIVKILNFSGQINSFDYTIHGLLEKEPTALKMGTRNSLKMIDSICFKNIYFKYNGQPVLCDLNFSMHAGDFLGITGYSGKGKTTILNLLLGFLEADEGRIFVNDEPTNIRQRQAYWQNISYVKQQSFLIHDTILHNITMEENTRDEKKLEEAMIITGLAEFIGSFPEKGDKLITEDGKNISGGQRQRIALARALYKNADLIILDEPFSELDEESEKSLLCHFKQLAEANKLIILITHNSKSLSFCKRVISLDSG